MFNGNASVREINRSLDISLPDQFVTLSGLIHDLAKEIPKVGKVFYVGDIKLQIISRSINKINKVKLSIWYFYFKRVQTKFKDWVKFFMNCPVNIYFIKVIFI